MFPIRRRAGVLLLPGLVLAACTAEPASEADMTSEAASSADGLAIAAELFYRERIALPPNAVAVAALRTAGGDRSIAETRRALEGAQVPVPVTLVVDPAAIPDGADLVWVGSILVDGAPAWRSEARPVDLAAGAVDLGSVMLTAFEPSPLEGGTWVVEDLGGLGIVDASRITLVFDAGYVAGQASCNTYRASWSLEGDRLSVTDPAVTLRMCPEALMNQERRFLDAIVAADGFRLDDTGALVLTSEGEGVLRARREP